MPQFVATFIAMVVFATMEHEKNPEMSGEGIGNDKSSSRASSSGLSGTAVCLAIRAVCSFVAAIGNFRLQEFEVTHLPIGAYVILTAPQRLTTQLLLAYLLA